MPEHGCSQALDQLLPRINSSIVILALRDQHRQPHDRSAPRGRLKTVERIPRGIGPERGSLSGTMRQEQGDQIRGALKQPVEPVIRFQTPPTDTGQPSASPSTHSTPVLPRRASVFSRVFRPRACGGHQPLPPTTPAPAQKPPAQSRNTSNPAASSALGHTSCAHQRSACGAGRMPTDRNWGP